MKDRFMKNGVFSLEYDKETLRDMVLENQELKKQLEEVEFIVGLRQKRNLISKFDKEFDEEDKKKNPNREYAGIMPDAEEVYRRYYTMKNQQKEFIEFLVKQSELYKKDMENINYIKEPFKWEEYNDIVHEYKVILSKYKEIIGENKND